MRDTLENARDEELDPWVPILAADGRVLGRQRRSAMTTTSVPVDPELCRALQGGVAMPDLSREVQEYPTEGYCVLCEREGHTLRSCPTRDDDFEDPE